MALSNSRIALDTNMLLAIPMFKVDLFGGIREKFGANVSFFVTNGVLKELEKISKKGKKHEKEVAIVKAALEKNEVKEIDRKGQNTDNSLAGLAIEGFLIATNDKELRKKIKTLGGHNIYLKKRKIIETE